MIFGRGLARINADQKKDQPSELAVFTLSDLIRVHPRKSTANTAFALLRCELLGIDGINTNT
jgi:hypothetical protein